jgi:hypothetical protein
MTHTTVVHLLDGAVEKAYILVNTGKYALIGVLGVCKCVCAHRRPRLSPLTNGIAVLAFPLLDP